MLDAAGFRLSEDDLHPRGACRRCGRVMIRRTALRDVELPRYVARAGAHGRCVPCQALAYRAQHAGKPVPPFDPEAEARAVRLQEAVDAADLVALPDTVPARHEQLLGMVGRGAARTVAENTAARDAYIAARRRRLARSQGRTLRAALSAGWGAL